MIKPWLLQTASRYIFTKRSAFWIILISMIGIMAGVAILVVILSIMNGSQMIYYENSQELLSYHVRIDCSDDYVESFQYAQKIRRDLKDVASVNLFFEVQGMLVNSRGKQIFVMLRGVEPDIMHLDPRMQDFLSMKTGAFELDEDQLIVLGSDMARALSVSTGSELSFYSLSGGAAASIDDIEVSCSVSGVYETDWGLGVDSVLAFIPLSMNTRVASGIPYRIGLKLNNNTQDQKVIAQLEAMGLPEGWKATGWRDYNRSFFGALRMEKTVMLLLVVLIFIVFAVNTYNGLSRLIYDKQEELGILRAMGAAPHEVRTIFILQGLFIALVGALFGSLLGLMITVNLEELRSFLMSVKDELLYQFFPGAGYNYAWNNTSFNEPRIMLKDLMIINFLALFISLAASALASRKIGKIKPAEVLRYE